jgi:hypothetical protein
MKEFWDTKVVIGLEESALVWALHPILNMYSCARKCKNHDIVLIKDLNLPENDESIVEFFCLEKFYNKKKKNPITHSFAIVKNSNIVKYNNNVSNNNDKSYNDCNTSNNSNNDTRCWNKIMFDSMSSSLSNYKHNGMAKYHYNSNEVSNIVESVQSIANEYLRYI